MLMVRKKVVFLMSDTGAGHRAVADAIRAGMEARYPDTYTFELVDVYRRYTPFPFTRLPEIYPRWVDYAPLTWELAYNAANAPHRGRVIMALIAARIYVKSPDGRYNWHSLLMKLPVVKKLIENTIAARLSRTLGTLTATGVPLAEALGVTARVVGNAVAEKAIRKIQEDVTKGDSIALSMERMDLFPIMLVQMTQVGEESGTLDSMLSKTADYYEGEVEASVGRLTAMMEPAIIVVLGGIVAFIVLSIALPMFDMVNLAGA